MRRAGPAGRTVVLLALSGWLAACAGSIPRPAADQAVRAAGRSPGVTLESLSRGRALYVAKCSGCHALEAPAAHPEAFWAEHVPAMADRARLSGDEPALILRYLEAVRPQSR
ncbi:MAG: hypothetical protein AAB152_03340 [Candidatus Coatesbacteria bacterium]